MLISRDAITGVISTLTKVLRSHKSYDQIIDNCARLATYLSTMIYTEKLKLFYGDELLLALFTLSTKSDISIEALSKDTAWEVTTAWQDVIYLLAPELPEGELKTLTTKFADIIETEVLQNDGDLDNIVILIGNFVKSTMNCVCLTPNDIVALFTQRAFISKWVDYLSYVCMYAEYVRGNLSSPYEQIKKPDESVPENDIPKYLRWMQFVARVLSKPVMIESCTDDEDEDDTENVSTLPIVKLVGVTDHNIGIIIDLFYSLAIAQSFSENYKSVSTF